jgi:hypothetical protein
LDWALLDLALTAAGGNSTLWEFGPAVPAVLHHQANGSMSYDIITQQHGGAISVDSRVGEYSELTVRLPRSS